MTRTILAGGFAGAHHRLAHAAHDGAHVGEVEVDQAFLDHEVGDAGDAGIEHLVGHLEGIGEGGLFIGDPEQILVRDDDQRIDVAMQFIDAVFRKAGAAIALEGEGLGDDADGQDACSRAARAITGAAPVPVPPPMPAVMNTMCEPER